MAFGTGHWHQNAIEQLVRNGPGPELEGIRFVSGPMMIASAALHIIALAFMVAQIKGLPGSNCAKLCILLVLPAAGLTFMAICIHPRRRRGHNG